MKQFTYFTCLLLALSAHMLPGSVRGAEITFIAADKPGRTPVSDLMWFRRSPYGGIVATQWVSNVRVNGEFLFPYQGPAVKSGASVESAQQLDRMLDMGGLGKEEQALEAVKGRLTDKKRKERAVDRVDPLYAELPPEYKVGPRRMRYSYVWREIDGDILLEPGGHRLRAVGAGFRSDSPAVDIEGNKVYVKCYPVRIRARRGGHAVPFTPRLSWRRLDLMERMLFEYSPDCPLGVVSGKEVNHPHGAQSRPLPGEPISFFELTVYLPPTVADQPGYTLNGTEFRLTEKGVSLSEDARMLRKREPFALELQLPPEKTATTVSVPVTRHPDARARTETPEAINVPAEASGGKIRFSMPGEKRVVEVAYQLPALSAGAVVYREIVLDEAQVFVFGLKPADTTVEGTLHLWLTAWQSDGRRRLQGPVEAKARAVGQDAEPLQLAFRPSGDGLWSADASELQPALYELSFPGLLAHGHPFRLLAVVVRPGTRGAVSVFTEGNRSDYRQGERVQVTVLARTAGAPGRVPVALQLVHENGRGTQVGALELSAAAHAAAFAVVETDALMPGRYRLRAQADGFLAHPAPLVIHQGPSRSTFKTFAHNQVCTPPVRAGDDIFVRHVQNTSPLSYLTSAEQAALVSDGRLPAGYKVVCAGDPFWPAPQRTAVLDEPALEMAAAQRLGIDFYPHYGWGLGPYESNWNPKHSLPEELDRIRRLCSLVVQRHRDFANFGGLHLNWYPTLKGYWEGNPCRDGNAGPRRKAMYEKAWVLTGPPPKVPKDYGKKLAGMKPTEAEYRSEKAQQFRDWNVRYRDNVNGALPRAYEAWTAGARGLGDYVYNSWVPVNWFRRSGYYAPVYFKTLPAVSLLCYTDYGFSAFQAPWALDYYGAGVQDKPAWLSIVSTTRGTMVRHTFLPVARGASAVDFGAWRGSLNDRSTLMNFLEHYGPYFTGLEPVSEIAILGSHRQIVNEGGGPGCWGGHTGGPHFSLYTDLWYAGRPADFLTDREVTPERLKQFKALFIVRQRVPLHEAQMRALEEFEQAGGILYKDTGTAPFYPGRTFDLKPDGKKRYPGPYKNMDPTHVGAWAHYLSVAGQLDELLRPLGQPTVKADRPNILVSTMRGRDTAVAFVLNDTHPPEEIVHPWSFWMSKYLAIEGELTFDAPYVVYDLFRGGQETRLKPDRRTLPVSFNRVEGTALVLTHRPIAAVRLQAPSACAAGQALPLTASVMDEEGKAFADRLPFEVTLTAPGGAEVLRLYRALNAQTPVTATIPRNGGEGPWRLKVRELVSGRTAIATIDVTEAKKPATATTSQVLIQRPRELRRLLARRKRLTILLDEGQEGLKPVAEQLAAHLQRAGKVCEIESFDPYAARQFSLRWRRPERHEQLWQRVLRGETIAVRRNLRMTYLPKKDVLAQPPLIPYPDSGWSEEGPQHLIYRDVIVMGTPETSRFIADLHATVGRRMGRSLDATALVQLISDAFAPRFCALSIQAADAPAMERAVNEFGELLAADAEAETMPMAQATGALKAWKSDAVERPVNLARDHFGRSVRPVAFLEEDGRMLVSAGFDAANWLLLDREANVLSQRLRRASVTISGTGETLWMPNWVGHLCPADKEMNARWKMHVPPLGLKGRDWSCSGRTMLTHPTSDDVFLAGQNYAARLRPDGTLGWHYDDTQTWSQAEHMRHPRGVSLLGVSPDGRHLLAMAFGTTLYYWNFVTGLARPEAILLDAGTGKVIWRKGGLELNHAAAAITNEHVLLGSSAPDNSFIAVYDLSGREKARMHFPGGLAVARLADDGRRIIGRRVAWDRRRRLAVGAEGPLLSISLADRQLTELGDARGLHHWAVSPDGARVLVSTTDDRLVCYTAAGERQWEKRLSESSFRWSPDSRSILVGTSLGRLLALDRAGKELWRKDLMPLNLVRDWDRYVREYRENPGEESPLRFLTPPDLRPIQARQTKAIKFSKNLLTGGAFDNGADGWSVEGGAEAVRDAITGDCLVMHGTLSQRVRLAPEKTHVLSLFQRIADQTVSSRGHMLSVRVRGGRGVLYEARVPVSTQWEERTFSWRVQEATDATVELAYVAPAQAGVKPGLRLGDVALTTVRWPSPNILKRGATTARISLDEDLAPEPQVVKIETDQTIPQDQAPQGRMSHRPKNAIVMLNGDLTDAETSWLREPVAKDSSCAFFTITFEQPQKLAAVAVYDDHRAPQRLTRNFGVFLRDAETKKWRMAGHVLGNQSPYHLFSFEPGMVDSIQYFWQGSGDGHVRLMEIEAYVTGGEALLMP